MDYSGQDLREVAIEEGAVLHDSNFDRANAERVAFDASCTDSTLRGMAANGADFSRGVHVSSQFDDSEMVGALLPDNDAGSFRGVDARGAIMRQRAFDETDWSGAKVHGAFIHLCGYYGADLSEIEGLEDATTAHNYYDDATKFPPGYDPEANGWVKNERPPELVQSRDRMRDAARTGQFDPLTNYAE